MTHSTNDAVNAQSDSTTYDPSDDGSPVNDDEQVSQDESIAANATESADFNSSHGDSGKLDREIDPSDESTNAMRAFESGVSKAGDQPFEESDSTNQDFESDDEVLEQS